MTSKLKNQEKTVSRVKEDNFYSKMEHEAKDRIKLKHRKKDKFNLEHYSHGTKMQKKVTADGSYQKKNHV